MPPAQVAKLVDALCSGRSVRKDVMVRIHSWAQKRKGYQPFLFLLSQKSTLISNLTIYIFQLFINISNIRCF